MFLKNLNLTKILAFFVLFFCFEGCIKFDPADTKDVPVDGKERARKNLASGKGFAINTSKNKGGSFEFASSNEMWRASLDILDFISLANVDYSGGIIVTDWFNNDIQDNESLKISVRFLSNEIRADGLDIIIHKKKCNSNGNCTVQKIDNKINDEIKLAILKRATSLKNNIEEKSIKKYKKEKPQERFKF